MATSLISPDLLEALRKQRLAQSMPSVTSSPGNDPSAPSPSQGPAAPSQGPPQPGPAAQSYQQALQNPAPQQSDYHPSVGRRIGGTLLGIIAGMHDPKSGYEVGRGVTYGPYDQKLSQYQQDLARRKAAFEEENTQTETSAKVGEQGAQKSAEEARAEAEKARKQNLEFETSPAGFQQKMDLAKVEHPGTASQDFEPYVLELSNGEKLPVSFNKRTGRYTDPVSGAVISQDSKDIKSATKVGTVTQNTPKTPASGEPKIGTFGDYLKRYAKGINKEPEDLTVEDTDKAKVEYARAQAEGAETPALKAQRTAGATSTTASAAHTAQETADLKDVDSPENVANWVNQMKANPQTFYDITNQNLKDKVSKAWTAASGKPLPKKLDTQTLNTMRTSQTALAQVSQLRKLLSDPDISTQIGPLLGRVSTAGQFVGDLPQNLTPQQKEKGQMLRALMQQIVITEAKNLSGGVARSNLIKELKSTSPNPNMVQSLLKGALDAIEANAKVNMQTSDFMQYGATDQSLPGGVTMQEIDDEIAKRKK